MLIKRIRESDAHPTPKAERRGASKATAILLATFMCLEPALALAKKEHVLYMGNDPGICGVNKKTGKPNLCTKEIQIERYLELHPGMTDFYSHRPARMDSLTAEKLQEKVSQARRNIPEIGTVYLPEEVRQMQELMKTWSDTEIMEIAKGFDPKLSDEETKILAGAARKWTWHFLKSHSTSIGLDPRLVFTVVVAESRLWHESGDSGKAKTPMQIISDPTDPDNTTAGLMYRLFGKDDPFIKELENNWRNDRNALMKLALYYLREAVKEADCKGIPFEKLTAKQLLAIYHFYNKGHKYNGETTRQQRNFANAMYYLKLYPRMEAFLETIRQRTSTALLAQHVKKEIERIDAEKAKVEERPPTKPLQR